MASLVKSSPNSQFAILRDLQQIIKWIIEKQEEKTMLEIMKSKKRKTH